MQVETRWKTDDGHKVIRGLVLMPTKEESKMIDECLGSFVGEDGLISTATVEVRLADGYGEHYLYIPAL